MSDRPAGVTIWHPSGDATNFPTATDANMTDNGALLVQRFSPDAPPAMRERLQKVVIFAPGQWAWVEVHSNAETLARVELPGGEQVIGYVR